MDADLDLPSDYSTALSEVSRGTKSWDCFLVNIWRQSKAVDSLQNAALHASGASKMVRAQCFADIGGFVPYRGWATIDEIRAEMKG